MKQRPTVAIIGTLDTKEQAFSFLKYKIEEFGADVIFINTGIFASPGRLIPDIPSSKVALSTGVSLEELARCRDRGFAMQVMADGSGKILKKLYSNKKIHAVISMGGSGGTSIGTSAMRVLPFGFPKIMVSTVASGNTSSYIGESDIIMVPSVVDVEGLNRISRDVFTNTAVMAAGLAVHWHSKHKLDCSDQEKGDLPENTAAKRVSEVQKPIIAATMYGVTTPCVTHARELLEEKGFEVLVFHAVGSGGRAMEHLIKDGMISGVLDLTTSELVDELYGGIYSAGSDRLEAAGKAGIPQVVSAGAIEMINFGPIDTVPEQYKGRKMVVHNGMNTLVRTTAEENRGTAKLIAKKLNQAKGKTVFVMPMEGFSMLDQKEGEFYDPVADKVFLDTLRENLNDNVELVCMDVNINAPIFAEKAVSLLLENYEK